MTLSGGYNHIYVGDSLALHMLGIDNHTTDDILKRIGRDNVFLLVDEASDTRVSLNVYHFATLLTR